MTAGNPATNRTNARKARAGRLVLGYPFALIATAALANHLLLGVGPAVVALPSHGTVLALGLCGVLLLVNHTWLMTSTELTRLKHDLSATPEERRDRGPALADITPIAREALERRHNAHRNTTENIVHFAILALPFALISPSVPAAFAWIAGFGAARLGYTYCYLSANTAGRGVFMSLGLLALYGMAEYNVAGLLS